eukprot:2161331-Pleurochrysis_carterae.AAC.1
MIAISGIYAHTHALLYNSNVHAKAPASSKVRVLCSSLRSAVLFLLVLNSILEGSQFWSRQSRLWCAISQATPVSARGTAGTIFSVFREVRLSVLVLDELLSASASLCGEGEEDAPSSDVRNETVTSEASRSLFDVALRLQLRLLQARGRRA